MQIIIPMSGAGERFVRAGYELPKPLIPVDGKPIIGHVIELFPGEKEFIFICREDHLANPKFKMEETVKRFCPGATIVSIAAHKQGPVHAVLAASHVIKPDRPALVSYCDYSGIWDYAGFKKMVEATKCDGAVVGYTGFHPHMLRNHRYGYVRMEGERVVDIREKQPYTDDPMSEIALCGAYYFRKADAMLAVMTELQKHSKLAIEGEQYVSMAYKLMLDEGAEIRTYVLDHFMQWGTPEDLRDYEYYSSMLRASKKATISSAHTGYIVMPMAGQGKRFADAGFVQPKPLIPVSGAPMAVQALRDLPQTPKTRVVLRRDLPQVETLQSELPKQIKNLDILMLEHLTEGQAMTALAGLEGVGNNDMVTIASCDNGAIYNSAALNSLLRDASIDVIVWAARGYPFAMRNAHAYGWINADASGKIMGVSVKVPLANPAKDPIIMGAFTFRRAEIFRRIVERMQKRDARVNGEFYIDTAINDAISLELNCRLFAIDYYKGWGTPDELKTYNYWEECFEGNTW